LKPIYKTFFLMLNLFIINFFVLFSAASAENLVNILVLPFNIHSEQDLTFLQKGIGDMLSSRLSVENKVVLISRKETNQAIEGISEPITEEIAASLAAKLQADYVLLGSLTVFGESISTDARCIDVHSKTPVIIFNQLGKNHGDVVSHINLFADQINEKVFGRKASASKPTPAKEAEINIRSHPDTIMSEERVSGSGFPDSLSKASNAQFVFWKSRRFKTEIKGIAVGDVDGDSKNEIVFISENKIFIYRHTDKRMHKIKEITMDSYHHFIGVDTADINNNGKSEIFISNISDDYHPMSFVLEWNGTEFKNISEKTGWYYRVINAPERSMKMLLGQKGGIRSIFSGNIYELKWNNMGYEPQDKQVLPKWINVYGFAYGDILNNDQKMIAAFQSNDSLNIMDMNGKEEWTSSEAYGGSSTYLVAPSDAKAAKRETKSGDKMAINRLYLPQRIHIADLDKNGRKEVVVVKNHDSSGRTFSRVRIFNSGHFESLEWDNVGLSKHWKTRKFSGYISDYAVCDINNDGQKELVFALTSKVKGSLGLGSKKSYIVSIKIH